MATSTAVAGTSGIAQKSWWKANQRRLAPWLFLAPGVFMFLVYVIFPIFESMWISFYDWDGIGDATWIGWDNYVEQAGYVTLALEQLIADPPDAILWSAQTSPSLSGQFARHPLLRELLAESGRGHRDYWRWQCPGPWTLDLIQELAVWQKD